MDNEEIAIIEVPSTGDLIKEAAIKAATAAIVSVVVSSIATLLVERIAKRRLTKASTEPKSTES